MDTQSVEFLLTCAAIFVISHHREKGWKPFAGGLFIVTIGMVMSAFSSNIVLFILSRGVVGLGYGLLDDFQKLCLLLTMRRTKYLFCHAECRNLCRNELRYALGSILVDIIGYRFGASDCFS